MSIFTPRERERDPDSRAEGAGAPDGGALARGYPRTGYPGGSYPGQYGSGAVKAPGGEDDEIDLRGLLLTLWRRKWVVVISAGFAALLGILVSAQMTPVYTAKTKVLFAPERMQVIDLQEVLVNPETRDQLQNQIEILRSTSLLERVARGLNLARRPEFNPALRTAPPTLGERVAGMVGAAMSSGRQLLADLGVMAPPPERRAMDDEARERVLWRWIVARLRGGLSLQPVRGSRVIDLAFTSTSPALAARIANAVAEAYIARQVEAKVDATRSATEWLSKRVGELQERVRKAEEAIAGAREELSSEAGQGSDITRAQLQALNATLTETRAEISELESRHDRVRSAIRDGADAGTVTEFRNSGIIQGLRAEESDLLSQRAQLRATVDEGHPALARLGRRLEEVRDSIGREAERISQALFAELEATRAKERDLVTDLRALETKALEQSRNELELRQLEREAEASRALYENFLARLNETSQQQGLQTADARILSRAERPTRPETTSKRLVVMGAGGLGMMIGLGVVLLLEKLNNTYRSLAELEEATGRSVLATLPRVGLRARRADVLAHIREKPSGSLAESVRNLRTSILFSNVDAPPRVVMFSSSAPREGKSTTSMLVALTSQQMGRSAVVVDCDLRLPALTSLFPSDGERPDLLNVIEGSASIDEAVAVEPESGLNVLTTRALKRRAQVNAADILASRRFASVIEALKRRYDLVILDTPPALVVTDARIVSRLADAVVFTVRWDSTPRGAVLEGLRELDSVKAPLAGMVLTLVNESKAAKYAYDKYGYYKGRYRDYYAS